MRKQFIGMLTWYMFVFACFNIGFVALINSSNAGCFESVITIAAINGILVLVFRDIANKHECIASKRARQNNAGTIEPGHAP